MKLLSYVGFASVILFSSVSSASGEDCLEAYHRQARMASAVASTATLATAAGTLMAGSLYLTTSIPGVYTSGGLATGFLVAGAGVLSRRFAGLIAGVITEGRANRVGIFSVRAARLYNLSVFEPVNFARQLLGQQVLLTKGERRRFSEARAAEPITARDMMVAIQQLDPSEGLCTVNGRTLFPREWVAAVSRFVATQRIAQCKKSF